VHGGLVESDDRFRAGRLRDRTVEAKGLADPRQEEHDETPPPSTGPDLSGEVEREVSRRVHAGEARGTADQGSAWDSVAIAKAEPSDVALSKTRWHPSSRVFDAFMRIIWAGVPTMPSRLCALVTLCIGFLLAGLSVALRCDIFNAGAPPLGGEGATPTLARSLRTHLWAAR
jgi:hypothetical protein